MASLNRLRPIIQRLNLTPVEELPQYAGALAASILNCSSILQSKDGQGTETAVQLHKLTTRVSSLLQDRTQEGRFTGLVLVKSLIEAGSPQLVASSGPTWVRSMLSCLNKPDPSQVKKLAIITITRIFLITFGDQALMREVTSPLLPAFLTACLSVIKPTTVAKDGTEKQVPSVLLSQTLLCWVELVKCFPSTFRPFVSSIRAILLSILSNHVSSSEVKQVAVTLFATLHFCAAKDNSANEWIQTIKLILEAAHQNTDFIFRSITEEWTGIIPRQASRSAVKRNSGEVRNTSVDAIGLERWTGLHAGISRTLDLLSMLEAMVTSQHAQAVRIPLAEIIDLTARLSAVLPPTQNFSLRENKEIGKEEREELYANLSRLHCASLDLHRQMASMYGRALIDISQTVLMQVWDVFQSGLRDSRVRTATYKLIRAMLDNNVVALLSSDADNIADLVRHCCNDLKAQDQQVIVAVSGSKSMSSKPNSHRNSAPSMVENATRSTLKRAAWNLLPTLLRSVPTSLLSSSTRAEIDRVAILSRHEEILFTSIMHPIVPRKGAQRAPSILPFLAMADSGSLTTEALLRPRQPVIQIPAGADNVQIEEEAPEKEHEVMSTETDLLKLSDHISMQLENNPHKPHAEAQQARKRDITSTEDEASSPVMAIAKRARTSSPSPESDKATNTTHMPPMQVDARSETNIQPTEDKQDIVVITSPSLTLAEGQTTDTNFGSTSGPPLKDHAEIHDDDSDDSAIPMIDAALSSEDEEDDPED